MGAVCKVCQATGGEVQHPTHSSHSMHTHARTRTRTGIRARTDDAVPPCGGRPDAAERRPVRHDLPVHHQPDVVGVGARELLQQQVQAPRRLRRPQKVHPDHRVFEQRDVCRDGLGLGRQLRHSLLERLLLLVPRLFQLRPRPAAPPLGRGEGLAAGGVVVEEASGAVVGLEQVGADEVVRPADE